MKLLEFLANFPLVTTGISLAAFIVAALLLYFRYRHIEKLTALQKASAKDAVQLVNDTLVALDLQVQNLSNAQRFDLAKRELDRIAKKELYKALSIGLISVTLIVLTYIGYFYSNGGMDKAQAIRDIRAGTPAAREAAVNLIQDEKKVSEFTKTIGKEIQSGTGSELCNLLLSATIIDPNKNIEKVIKAGFNAPEYQLTNPVCTSINKPDFSDAHFSNFSFVRPHFIDVNFTRSTWIASNLRDDPDYSGHGNTECRINKTRFAGATLKESAFSGCDLSHVDFNSADFENVNFHRVSLTRVEFNSAKMKNVRFLGAVLTHVDLRRVTGDFLFALGAIGHHVRIDFDTARKTMPWPSNFQPIQCISSSTANQCWDLVSDDVPECRALAASKTYVVFEPEQEGECGTWAKANTPG